ncbi:hypothetical protein BPTFM16_00410 [Altererythrobacter insulae]|nr:hypothetical protein BPTFM16_00410 [Altererythrobacter insulae]
MEKFDQVAFSGGGIRCFWHGGFLSKVGNVDQLSPQLVTGVSGGVLSGASWIAQKEDELLDLMCEAFRINDSNLERDGVQVRTPHEAMYRAVVETLFDHGAVQAVSDGPEFCALLAVAPKAVPPKLAALIYGAIYKIDETFRSNPDLKAPSALGLNTLKVDARLAARDGRLVDLICAAATIPPVFSVPRWDGQRVIDAGMASKIHLSDDPTLRSLALLTKRYENVPERPNLTFVSPSEEVAADKIDFTDATKVHATWELGERDAERWLSG